MTYDTTACSARRVAGVQPMERRVSKPDVNKVSANAAQELVAGDFSVPNIWRGDY